MSEIDSIRKRCEQLEALYALARELLQLEDYEEMLDTVMRRCLASLGAERGFLVLIRGDELDFKVVRNWRRDDLGAGREPVSRAILGEVMRAAKPTLVEDALRDPRFAARESVMSLDIRSVLAAPLSVEGHLAGVIYLETSLPERLFGVEHLDLFTQMLDLSSKALEVCLERLLLRRRNSLLEKDFLARYNFQGIVTQDPAFLQLLETVAQVATSDLPVLVQGPSGSGKELIVRALHLNSPRSKKPFVTLNCGAISPALLESELFGHIRGAFTGAVGDKQGLISAAHTGTMFLDEVGELPKELQAKLLRTLQFGEIQPVGSTRTKMVDVRFIAATNRDLEQEVREGRFREDLLYRLNAVTLRLPALKERRNDILPLFRHFLEAAAEKAGRPAPELPRPVEQALERYDWPGNVRELENEARRLLALTPTGRELVVEHLSHRLVEAAQVDEPPPNLSERELIEYHLRQSGGNRTHAAQNMGISREWLRKKMQRYGLS